MSQKKQLDSINSEWSRPVEAEKVSTKPMLLSLKPTAEERKLLAKRLGVLDIKDLKANLTLIREPGKMSIHVTGSLQAQVKQECVVSGQPCEDTIEEDFEAWYADTGKTVPFARARQDKMLEKGNAEMPMLDESEDPEPIINGVIDAGELVTQYLSLSINPYPHAPGVHYEHGDEDQPQPRLDNPFSKLKDWKKKKD